MVPFAMGSHSKSSAPVTDLITASRAAGGGTAQVGRFLIRWQSLSPSTTFRSAGWRVMPFQGSPELVSKTNHSRFTTIAEELWAMNSTRYEAKKDVPSLMQAGAGDCWACLSAHSVSTHFHPLFLGAKCSQTKSILASVGSSRSWQGCWAPGCVLARCTSCFAALTAWSSPWVNRSWVNADVVHWFFIQRTASARGWGHIVVSVLTNKSHLCLCNSSKPSGNASHAASWLQSKDSRSSKSSRVAGGRLGACLLQHHIIHAWACTLNSAGVLHNNLQPVYLLTSCMCSCGQLQLAPGQQCHPAPCCAVNQPWWSGQLAADRSPLGPSTACPGLSPRPWKKQETLLCGK